MQGACGRQATGEGNDVDPLSAVVFLEREADALRDALARPDDRDRVLTAVHSQESAHESWLALVGKANRGGRPDLAENIAALYGFHGRVAAALERGFDPLLAPAVQERVRILLIAQLEHLTSRAVRGLVPGAPTPKDAPKDRAGVPTHDEDATGAPSGSPRRVG